MYYQNQVRLLELFIFSVSLRTRHKFFNVFGHLEKIFGAIHENPENTLLISYDVNGKKRSWITTERSISVFSKIK